MTVIVDKLTDEELESIEVSRAKAMGDWIIERRSKSPIINSLRFNYLYVYMGDMMYGSSKDTEGCQFELKVHDDRKHIHLAYIGVQEGRRNQGRGAEMMRVLTRLADQYGYTIDLNIDTKFGSNKRGLIRFYERFGFIHKASTSYERPVKGLKP